MFSAIFPLILTAARSLLKSILCTNDVAEKLPPPITHPKNSLLAPAHSNKAVDNGPLELAATGLSLAKSILCTDESAANGRTMPPAIHPYAVLLKLALAYRVPDNGPLALAAVGLSLEKSIRCTLLELAGLPGVIVPPANHP